jgi:hypothetical protein
VRHWRWRFRRFWPSKTQIFVHLGRETYQKRLRNGWRNGRVAAKVTAGASPRGDQRSWGVVSPSDQASRRSSPARARVPLGPFSPTLYLHGAIAGFGAPPSVLRMLMMLAVSPSKFLRFLQRASSKRHSAGSTLAQSRLRRCYIVLARSGVGYMTHPNGS